jgi:hypothetical protein
MLRTLTALLLAAAATCAPARRSQTLRCDDGTSGTIRADGLPMLQAMPASARTAPRISGR